MSCGCDKAPQWAQKISQPIGTLTPRQRLELEYRIAARAIYESADMHSDKRAAVKQLEEWLEEALKELPE